MYYAIPDESGNGEGWRLAYILDDIVLTVFFLMIIIVWPLYLLLKKSMLKDICKFVLIGLSLIYFYAGFVNVAVIAQDAAPYYGSYLIMLILPLMLCYLISRRQSKKAN